MKIRGLNDFRLFYLGQDGFKIYSSWMKINDLEFIELMGIIGNKFDNVGYERRLRHGY